MKNKEMNKVFKQVLKTFVEETFDSCEDFVNEIHNCSTYGELKEMLEENAEYIAKKLNMDMSCDNCSDKDDEIEDLEDSITDLTSENEEMYKDIKKGFVPISLDDVYKFEAFKAAKDNFSVSEMESLLS